MKKNFEYLEVLVEKLKDKNGNISSEKIKRNPEIVNEIESNLLLEKFKTFKTKLYAIKNRIEDPPKCLCGDELKPNKSRGEYQIFCSIKCPELIRTNKEKVKETSLKKYGVEYSSQSEEAIEKRNKTNIERYGGISPLVSKVVQQKVKQTHRDRYGVENPQQSEEIRNKTKDTNLERYGTASPLQCELIKNRIKNTILEKYGVEFINQSEIIKEIKRKSNLEKYGVEHPKQSETLKKINRENFIKDRLPVKLARLKEIYEIVPYNWELEDYKTSYDTYLFRHTICGKIFKKTLNNGGLPRCPRCHLLNSSSKIEQKLQDDLISIFTIDVVKCNDRKIIKPCELDIVIDGKLAVEVNGAYWHREEAEGISLLEKSNLCPIPILHFWDFELENKYEICKSMILSKLGIYEETIYARKCQFKMVGGNEAKEFFELNHLQGKSNSKLNYGLYYNDELVLCIGISKPRFNKKYDLEIHRIASKLNTKVIGGVSKLFKNIKEDLKGQSLITYADKRYSNGDIYKFLEFTELKDSKPNYFWIKNSQILSRYQTQKHKLSKLLTNFDSNLTESENMGDHGFYKVMDCGNKVFIKQL